MKTAIILIDIQNDFLPGGALAVPEGDQIYGPILALLEQHPEAYVVATQDFHPPGHLSFASSHGKDPFTEIDMPYGRQMLWPDHCVVGTPGAAINMPPALEQRVNFLQQKGCNPSIDSYSAFRENDGHTETGLGAHLKGLGVREVIVAGLAYDYCVRFSAVDAVRAGFTAAVWKPGCRAISADGAAAAEEQFRDLGIVF